jgi:hypothetical protein
LTEDTRGIARPVIGDLYRALRPDEIAAGCVPIPKSHAEFLAPPRLPNVLQVKLGPSIEHALREHQWLGRYQTRGVSATTRLEVAIRYAGHSRVVIRMVSEQLASHGIELYRVADYLPESLIEALGDDEVVLVRAVDGPYPGECVAEIIRLDAPS